MILLNCICSNITKLAETLKESSETKNADGSILLTGGVSNRIGRQWLIPADNHCAEQHISNSGWCSAKVLNINGNINSPIATKQYAGSLVGHFDVSALYLTPMIKLAATDPPKSFSKVSNKSGGDGGDSGGRRFKMIYDPDGWYKDKVVTGAVLIAAFVIGAVVGICRNNT